MEPLRPNDPRQIGVYRLAGRLGAGGMGQVFLGESRDRGQVAVKVLKSEHAYDPRFRARFAREVAAAKMVSGAHTAPVVDADPDGDPPWLATSYIPGPSLLDAVSRSGCFPPEAVRRLGVGLAEGLAAIHARGLVHRDLKPANIILADDGPKIIDFGLVHVEGVSGLTTTGTVVGTLSYMSPEQVSGAPSDARGDVFSLGCVLAFAATGQGPFDAPTIPAVATRIAGAPPALDGVDGPLRSIIDACLAKEPSARPPLAVIASYLEQPDTYFPERTFVPASSPTAVYAATELLSEPRPRQGRGRSGAGIAAAALIAAVGVGAAFVLVTGGGPTARQPSAPATMPTGPAASAPPARPVPSAHSEAAPSHAPSKAPTGTPSRASAHASASMTSSPAATASQGGGNGGGGGNGNGGRGGNGR